jgi:high affinity Mn2+ porin
MISGRGAIFWQGRRRHAGGAAALLCLLLALAPRVGADTDKTVTLAEDWSLHGQSTLVWQANPGFHADFSGPNSLTPQSQDKETFDLTLFLGARLWRNLAFYANPEVDQGYGLSNTLGVAGFPSAEAYKVGEYHPYYRMPRAFFRYVQDLGGEVEADAAGANQLAGTHTHDNLTFTFGKFGVPDVFDTNKYAHDPRADFLNWTIIESGAFDYAADAWGFSYGAVAEWTQSRWTLRAGVFDLSRQPNSTELTRGLGQFQMVTEAEERHELWKQPGAVKLLFFANRGNMGSYGDALAQAAASGGPPNTASVRRYDTRAGGGINLQQQLAPDLGAFLRASLNDGSKEAFEFTDVNRSLSGGLSLQGTHWNRANDTVGISAVVNTINQPARQYLAAGGLGILVGDGALPRYGPEKILETYYSVYLAEWANVSLDYQFVDNPAYNPERGPVSVFALRLHAEF